MEIKRIILLILANLLIVILAEGNSTEAEERVEYDYEKVLNRHKRQCACLSQYTPVNCKCQQADPSNSNDLACRCDRATVSPQCSCAPTASTLCFPVCQQQCIQSCVAQQQSLPQCQPPCQLICQRACQTLPQQPVYATLQPLPVGNQPGPPPSNSPLPVAPNQQIIYAIPQSQNQLPQPLSYTPSPSSLNAQSIGQASVFLPTQAQCIPLCTEQCMKNCPNSPGQCAQTCTNGCQAACSRQPSQFWTPPQQQDIVIDCANRCEPSCHRACSKLPNQQQPMILLSSCQPACVSMCQSNCQVNQPGPSQHESPTRNANGCTPLCRPDCSPKCVKQFVEPPVSSNLVSAQVGNRETATNSVRRTPQEFVVQASPSNSAFDPNMRTIFESEYIIPLDGNTKDIVIPIPIQIPSQQFQIPSQQFQIPSQQFEIPYGVPPAYPPYYNQPQPQPDLYYQVPTNETSSKVYEIPQQKPESQEQPNQTTDTNSMQEMSKTEISDQNRMRAATTSTATSPIQLQSYQNYQNYQNGQQPHITYQSSSQQEIGNYQATISQLAEYYQKLNQQLIAYQMSELNKSMSRSQIPESKPINTQLPEPKPIQQLPQFVTQPSESTQIPYQPINTQIPYQTQPPISQQLPQFVTQPENPTPFNYPQFSPPSNYSQSIQPLPYTTSQQTNPLYQLNKSERVQNKGIESPQKIKSTPNNPIPYAQKVETPTENDSPNQQIGLIASQSSPVPGFLLQNSYSSTQNSYVSPYFSAQTQRPITTWKQQPILPQPTYRTVTTHHQRHQPKLYSQIGEQKFQQPQRLYGQQISQDLKQFQNVKNVNDQRTRITSPNDQILYNPSKKFPKIAFNSPNSSNNSIQPPKMMSDPTAPLNDADTLNPGEISLNIDFPNLNGPQISDTEFQKSCVAGCQPNCQLNCVQQYKNGIRVSAKEAQSFFRRRYSKMRSSNGDKNGAEFDKWGNLKGGVEDVKNLTRDGNLQTLQISRPVGGSGRVYKTNGRENCEESCRRVCSRACEKHKDHLNDYKCSNKCVDECSQRCPNYFKARK